MTTNPLGSAAAAFKRLGLAFQIANLQIALNREARIPGLYRPDQVEYARARLATLTTEFDNPERTP